MSEHEVPSRPSPAPGWPDLVELERRSLRWWQPLLVALALLGLYWLGEWLDWRGELLALEQRIESFGVLAPLAFVIAYVLLTVLGFPGSPLTAAAGALFGAGLGVVVSLVASTLAATICFLIARHLVPARLRRRLAEHRSFRHLDRLVARRGPLVVVATRLVNLLPFFVVNYGFGLTRVPLRTYVVWSVIGKVPGTVVLVVGVDAVVEALREGRVPWWQAAVVATLALALTAGIGWSRRWLSDDAVTQGEAIEGERAVESAASPRDAA